MISFHINIWEKFFYDLRVHNSTQIQQLCPHPFLEHFKDASVLKGIQFHDPFHDNCGFFVAVNRLEVVRICASTFRWLIGHRMFSRRDLHIYTDNQEKEQVHKHKTEHKNMISYMLVQNKVKQLKTEYNQLKTKQTNLK